MEEAKSVPKDAVHAQRIFEQPPEAVSFYCELAQIMATENEVTMQFYEAVPGPPGPAGNITTIRSRLRATITFSHRHARNLGKLLTEKAAGEEK
jgi:hypothetical protein